MALFDFLKPKPEAKRVESPRIEPTWTPPKQKIRSVSPAWDGAKIDNLVSGWMTTPVPINQQIESDLRQLRARSRQLAKNDPYVKRFLKLCRTNTIGHEGVAFRSLVNRRNGNPDQPVRDAIAKAWKDASKTGKLCAKGAYSLLDMENLASDLIGREGEVIVRVARNTGEYGVTFRFIDPELLDVNHKSNAFNGNRVRMGIETNGQGAVVAYHFHSTDSTHSTYYVQNSRGYIRIPASEVIHCFDTEYVDQLRGFPQTAAAMLRLRMLNGYEEAELVGARGAASAMGFIIRGEDDGGFEGTETIVSDTSEEWGEALIPQAARRETEETIEAEAGSFHYLEKGAELQTFDPNHPNTAYAAFIKAVLRGIASGLGISYNTLANDLEGVNFSSIRTGVLEDREAWKARQTLIIEKLLVPMFEIWLETSVLAGRIRLAGGARLRSSDLDRFMDYQFQGRRWPWVDPVKDIQAAVAAIDKGLRSRSDVIREMGEDPIAVWEEIRDENERMDELGVTPATPAPAPAAEPDNQEDDQADDDQVEETDEETESEGASNDG